MCCVQKLLLSIGVTHTHRHCRPKLPPQLPPLHGVAPPPDRRCYFVKGCRQTTRWRPPTRTSHGGGGRDRPGAGDELEEAVETTSTRTVGRSSGPRTTGLGSSFFGGGSGSSFFGDGSGGTTFGSGGGGLGSSFLGDGVGGSTFFGGVGGGTTSGLRWRQLGLHLLGRWQGRGRRRRSAGGGGCR
jgi:hypothetical protein